MPDAAKVEHERLGETAVLIVYLAVLAELILGQRTYYPQDAHQHQNLFPGQNWTAFSPGATCLSCSKRSAATFVSG